LTDENAIQVIDEVVSKYHGTRQDHVILANAINHIKAKLLPELPQPVADEKPDTDK
jgi:hypothetical protein